MFGGKHVQVLFRSKLDSNINQIDVDQIAKVKEFKAAIHKMAIVAEFNNDEEIDGIINRFLMSSCQQLESPIENLPMKLDSIHPQDETTQVVMQSITTESEASLGFYDEIEVANQAANTQAELIGAYGTILNNITSNMAEILDKYGDDQQKKRFDLIGDMLSEKSVLMSDIVESFRSCSNVHFAAFENVLLMIEEFDVVGNAEGLLSLRNSLFQTSLSMAEFLEQAIIGKETTENSPRATQKFNHGKRRIAAIMGDMISLVEVIVNRFNEYVSYLDAYLKKSNN